MRQLGGELRVHNSIHPQACLDHDVNILLHASTDRLDLVALSRCSHKQEHPLNTFNHSLPILKENVHFYCKLLLNMQLSSNCKNNRGNGRLHLTFVQCFSVFYGTVLEKTKVEIC